MNTKRQCEIQFQPLGQRVAVPPGTTLLDAARLGGIDLATACGGEGSCGQCQVVILEGEVSSPTPDEEFMIAGQDRQQGYRLACCTQVFSSARIHLPKDSLITGQRLQVESNLRQIEPDPLVSAFPFELAPPDLTDIRSDLTRLKDYLQEHHSLPDLEAGQPLIQSLSPELRSCSWKAAALVRDREILGVIPSGRPPLGAAIDLGTTKIAASLVDLQSGQTLASAGIPNPQISYGEDVISRLNYAVRKPQGGQLLAEKVHHGLQELILELLRQVRAEPQQLADGCIVGNTAMTHLLLQYPVRQLATAPYVASASDALDVPAEFFGFAWAPGARVHIPPSIGGFIGADHVAMVLASDLDQAGQISLGIDIGTNTEISLRIPGQPQLTAISCASGPAFEGAHIRDGMRAASGAIEKVRILPEQVELTTIDNAPAVGICGSGILDAVAELYRAGCLDKHTRFRQNDPRIRKGDHGAEFLLVPALRSGSGRDIVISQTDVNEVVLAKGAIQAGLNVLLETTGLPAAAVQEVIVAGAFGSFINIQNAIQIGLFPRLPNARYRQVGNAAALGAKWILISRAARERARQIASSTRYLELTTYPKFSRQFAMGMLFPDPN
jgi:uncharacterized 2Fe-2S/4Fe-4S cluster protein (DUF4445 family)